MIHLNKPITSVSQTQKHVYSIWVSCIFSWVQFVLSLIIPLSNSILQRISAITTQNGATKGADSYKSEKPGPFGTW